MPSLIHLQFTFLQYSEDQCWKQQEGLHQSKGKRTAGETTSPECDEELTVNVRLHHDY